MSSIAVIIITGTNEIRIENSMTNVMKFCSQEKKKVKKKKKEKKKKP